VLKEERQQKILDKLYAGGQVYVDLLSRQFGTSNATIRRDLSELEEQGIVRRVYGGAVPCKKIPFTFDERVDRAKDEKFLVAKKAVELVRPKSLIAVDGGTTNMLFASLLPKSIELRAVTNSFITAEELRKRPNIEVIFLGGTYNKASQVTTGETTCREISEFYFDQCFLGAYAADFEIGITVPSPYEDEAAVKQAFVAHSAEVNVMCACSKLGQRANYVVCSIEDADRIICDHPVAKKIREAYGGRIV